MTSPEGWNSTTSGYDTLAIIRTPNGPAIDGPVPYRVGVEREALDGMVPALGSWTADTGTLIVLGIHFQQVGVDGSDIVVFEQCPR